MITESLLDLFLGIFRLLIGGFEIVGLPTQFINTLSTIMCYGTWVVGLDIMVIFVTNVIAWWTIKFSIGLFVWIWELLPFT